MSLKEKISVIAHYTRSINLERDANSIEVVNAYIPTSRALRTLQKISATFHAGYAPRAWSLVGPYGAGKSSFSVFLSHLLANPGDVTTKAAQAVLSRADSAVATSYVSEISGSEGYLKILVTGSPEPIGRRILVALAEAAEKCWQNRKGKKPKILDKLRDAVASGTHTTSCIVSLTNELQCQLRNTEKKGLLLIIDELGKFLEYEARHYGANDIYLLQELAEHACKGADRNLYLLVLLHQSFEQYAKGLGENLKNEWAKIQGRFEEVPFLESSEQVLRVVAAAFQHDLSSSDERILRSKILPISKILFGQQVLPPALQRDDADSLLISTYPLHPVSALLLPALCQKIAQNERTLFSYLGSHEEYGFSEMLDRLTNIGDFIFPADIFDYFIANQSAVMGDYLVHRRWVEVVAALERLGDTPPEVKALLKMIGVLNIIGSKGGLKASKELLETVFDRPSLTKGIKTLESRSAITYRRFSGEYRVWQGSDFDLEEALQAELANLGKFSLADELNSNETLVPIVARRYTISSGALRYFVPVFVDARSYRAQESKSDKPRLVFFLAAGQDDQEIFKNEVQPYFSDLDILVLCVNGGQLRQVVAETQALRRVRISCQELNNDPIAKREFEDRLTAAEKCESLLIRELVELPALSKWFYQGQQQIIRTRRDVQELMSTVLEAVYHAAPILDNELINRDNPSSQANAARNKLLAAMLSNPECEDLGIEKFPPEKAIYRSVLMASGIHKLIGQKDWAFTEPERDGRKQTKLEKKVNIRHVWNVICEFLDSTSERAKSFTQLNEVLMAPPYGMKAGVLPILYVAAYCVYKDELAIYENRRYKPRLTEEMVERFVKRPDEYEVQRFRIEGLRATIFEQYAKIVQNPEGVIRGVLDIARPLATFMAKLPGYTQSTERGLSKMAIEVRTAFNLAKSPESLLFQGLPRALGYGELSSGGEELAGFAESLKNVLAELAGAYDALMNRQRELLARAFNVDPKLELSELRKILAGKSHGLENYTVDTQGLRAFILRLKKLDGDDSSWLENILMFLGHKPSQKWMDSDQDAAEYRLTDYSRRVVDLEQLSLHEQKRSFRSDGEFDVYLLRSIKKGGQFRDQVVAVDESARKTIASAREAALKAIDSLKDNEELKLALIAEIVDKFLEQYHESVEKPQGRKVGITSTRGRRVSR